MSQEQTSPGSGWRLTAEQLDAICDRLATLPQQEDIEKLICHLGEVEDENALLRSQAEERRRA